MALNEKQEKFAQNYILHRNANRSALSAKAAGYSKKSASQYKVIDYHKMTRS